MLTIVMPPDARPTCAAPEHLAIVDAAFARPGGPESHWLRKHLCRPCPVRLECLLLGNATGEHGVWGGLNTKERVEAGGHSAYTRGGGIRNMQGVAHR